MQAALVDRAKHGNEEAYDGDLAEMWTIIDSIGFH